MIERAVTFSSAASLVGVVSMPAAPKERRPFVVFLNAGLVHRAGPNRLYVRMARHLADAGIGSLRFDLSGIGDSPARTDGGSVRDSALRDIGEALDFATRETGASTFVLVGLCSGADLALRTCLKDERIVGAVLIDGLPYPTFRSRLHRLVREQAARVRGGAWRRLLAPDGPIARRLHRRRRAPTRAAVTPPPRRRDVPSREEADAGLRAFTARGARLLVVSTPDRDYTYPRHFRHTFPGVPRGRVEVAYFRDADHTFTLRATQDELVRTFMRWISCFE